MSCIRIISAFPLIIQLKDFFDRNNGIDGDHIDLWDGNRCKGNCYFDRSWSQIWFIQIPPKN